jgi:CP family cyanate transporter-like MFS transporter
MPDPEPTSDSEPAGAAGPVPEAAPVRSLWAGRTLALVAIVLLALNLRTAVTALSPIVAFITRDVPLDPLLLGVIGMLPPLAFAAGGLIAPALTRRFGLEVVLVASCAVMVVGPLIRAVAGSPEVLLAGTVIMFLGVGIGNVLLPPAVKKYFPDRIGLVTSVYATVIAVSTSVPPAVAVPIAEVAGWRASLGMWAVLALGALVPWAVLLVRERRAARVRSDGAAAAGDTEHVELPTAVRRASRRLSDGIRRSRTAWAMALAMGANSVNAYAMFAWLPQLLIERSGAEPAEAGPLLALYAAVGLPVSLILPVLVVRMRSAAPLVLLGTVSYVLGYVGLLFLPHALTVLWVFFAGLGNLIFPLMLVLINVRTRTPAGSIALSGFVQGLGYLAAALGPVLVGVLRDVTGGWTAPLVFLLAVSLVTAISGVVLRRPGYVEDEGRAAGSDAGKAADRP